MLHGEQTRELFRYVLGVMCQGAADLRCVQYLLWWCAVDVGLDCFFLMLLWFREISVHMYMYVHVFDIAGCSAAAILLVTQTLAITRILPRYTDRISMHEHNRHRTTSVGSDTNFSRSDTVLPGELKLLLAASARGDAYSKAQGVSFSSSSLCC